MDVSEGSASPSPSAATSGDTIEYNRDKGVGVTIYDGQKRGYASTSDFSKEALKGHRGCGVSTHRPLHRADAASGLPDEALLATGHPDFDLLPPLEDLHRRRHRARQPLRARAFAGEPEIRNSDGASVSMQEPISSRPTAPWALAAATPARATTCRAR